MVNVPVLLKKARLEAEMTQEQAAEYSGVSANQISRYELGTATPALLSLFSLLETYGYQVEITKKIKPL